FHGTAFEYLRNNALDATDWFANANRLNKAALRQNDLGGVLGGPLVKDKTFFFLSYEGLRLTLPRSAATYVPSLYARSLASPALAPLLNMWPLPNRGNPGSDQYTSIFAASYSDPSVSHAGSVRIDQEIRTTLKLFGRFSYSPSTSTYRRG